MNETCDREQMQIFSYLGAGGAVPSPCCGALACAAWEGAAGDDDDEPVAVEVDDERNPFWSACAT